MLDFDNFMEQKTVLEVCFMCEVKDISRSKTTLRFLTVMLEDEATPSKVMISCDSDFLKSSGPSAANSVLSEFSSKNWSSGSLCSSHIS